ncbi:MAG: carbohydrate kinase family protein [Phycisphaerae bacterium]|jgi:sugar/nucleoside kinase (ribokinase family)
MKMETSIVTIGSANSEQILVVDKVISGSKNNCKFVKESFGGSAVNWGVRLKSINIDEIGDIYVACPIGGDGRGGRIQDELSQMKIKVIPSLPLPEGCTTSHSVIVVSGDERTVYTEIGSSVEKWAMSLAENIETEVPANKPIIAMIGNIAKSNDNNGNALIVTEQVISALSKKQISFIYANFGRAQYSFCYHHWVNVWDKINCFQLNVNEARDFVTRSCDCAECRNRLKDKKVKLPSNLSLYSILKFLKGIDATAVITLAGSGSVAVMRNDNNVIFTWPRQPTKHCDTTGSGDAFGAGVIWALLVYGKLKNVREYSRAFSAGSVWGASACSEYGGHKGTPDTSELFRALGDTALEDYPSIYREIDKAEPLLYMLDDKKYYF